MTRDKAWGMKMGVCDPRFLQNLHILSGVQSKGFQPNTRALRVSLERRRKEVHEDAKTTNKAPSQNRRWIGVGNLGALLA